MREDRVVFLKKQVAATEEQVRKKKKQTPSVSSSDPYLVSQQQKRKWPVDKGGKEKRIKEEVVEKTPVFKNSLAPKTYR